MLSTHFAIIIIIMISERNYTAFYSQPLKNKSTTYSSSLSSQSASSTDQDLSSKSPPPSPSFFPSYSIDQNK